MKPHLILLHGALGSANQLQHLANALEADFAVHLFNFSGHGGRPIPLIGLNFDVFMQDILEYMDSQNINQAAFFGYSMGGYAALYLAKHYPDRVAQVLTLGTKFDWTPETALKETRMLDADKISEKVPAFAAQLEKTHQPTDWKLLLKATAAMMIGLGDNPALSKDDLIAITQPVTIGVGDRDHTAGLDGSIFAYRALPNANLWVLPNTPHPLDKVSVNAIAEQLRLWK